MANNFFNKLFGIDKRYLKKIEAIAKKVDELKDKYSAFSDEELKAQTPLLKQRLRQGETLDQILPQAFATAREAAKRVLNQYPFFVQVIGAIVLHQGDVAEMRTGEGKTLTATMAVYLNALEGKGVHVVTVNEYLAQRDADWMGQIYKFLGLTLGVNLHELSPSEKQEAFNCDITYTTNSEVGFDYLRDNMKTTMKERVLRGLNFAVIDEADSILIDESRTPLIISGGHKSNANLYKVADRFAKSLTKDKHFTIDLKSKSVALTEEGVKIAEKAFKTENLYNVENSNLVHNIQQALKANHGFTKDVEYMVDEDEIKIIDSFTGRVLKGREYSDGLHQALQAKENVPIKEETVTVATITYQNFFRMYAKLSGMTGTAKTEEEEFHSIYNMRVVQIPTNRPIARKDEPDKIFVTNKLKLEALIEEVKELHAKGQPILIGTVSVESSEEISHLLEKAHLPHNVLNAKNHAKEAEIIAHAGEKGAITLATNMAGRGTDIKIDDEVKALGGLAVLGSERHESRRIDDQLRGRSGRQGDPGFSRFYVSFDDDLMKRFGSGAAIEMIKKQIGTEHLESKMLSRQITNAQKLVEGYNFDTRKNLIGYDDVLRQQRELMYKERDTIIEAENIDPIVDKMFNDFVPNFVRNRCHILDGANAPDIDKINLDLENIFGITGLLNKKQYEHSLVEDVAVVIKKKLIEKFNAKEEQWGEELFNRVKRELLIMIVDRNWTAHIDKMAKLRDGISLRSYAQIDPLQAYIKEGFKVFNQMTAKIAEEFCINFFRVKVSKPSEQTEDNTNNGENKQ